jgi:predicted homoserine dehydrogenase-like protein
VLYELDRLKPIRVGIIGMGSMGKGLAYQSQITPGIECVAIADIKLERAIACAEFLKRDYRVAHTLNEVCDVVRQSKMAICEDGALLAQCDQVDVLIESSGAIAAGGQFAATALEHGKHVVMMNAEADLLFGPYLMQLAQDHQVVYTTCDGDQPGVIKRLVDQLEFWGFELVMAGNIKGFLDRYSDPTKIIPEASKRNFDAKMTAGYTDGTKLCIEMALVANALGLATTVPGMMGPKAHHVREVFQLFDFDALRRSGPVVDYVLGAEPDGGVFAVGYCDNDYQRSMLSVFKMGDGPFYLYYRFNHLCHVEAMASVAEAYLNHRALLQPIYGFRTNVYTYAKRDLHRGENLDGFGGYTCYGLIENCDQNDAHPGFPICLAEGVTLKRNLRRDEKIFMDDIDYDSHRSDFVLFAKALDQSRKNRQASAKKPR